MLYYFRLIPIQKRSNYPRKVSKQILFLDSLDGVSKVGPVFRLAISGKGMGPSLFDICEILGKEETLNRIQKAIQNIEI